MKHKLLTALLVLVSALCLSFGLAACNGGAELYFELDPETDTYIVSGRRVTGDLVIPESYKGKPVTAISSYGFQSCPELTSVVIPDSVTSLGENMFIDCLKLTSVKIGSGVKSIGEAAFAKCTGLTSITIPDSVTSIGKNAFYGCSGLTSIVIPNSVTSIGDYAFSECTGLTSVEIGDGVVSLGKEVFSECTGLTSVKLGSGVLTIGVRAFQNCTGLTSITIPNSVTTIEATAFADCTGLTSITIPDSVTTIEVAAFADCFALKNVEIESVEISISDNAFDDCPIESVTIPASALSSFARLSLKTVVFTSGEIEERAFFIYGEGSDQLTSVVLEDGVTSIGKEAFRECTGLESVVIGSGVTTIGNGAFSDCSGLKSVELGSGVTTIEAGAFSDCTGLESVVIGSRVTSIGGWAFYGCDGLKNVYYEGMPADWQDIEIGDNNPKLTEGEPHYSALERLQSATENSFAAQSYHVTITSETLNTKIDQKLNFAGNIEYSEMTMGGETLKMYRAVEDGKVYVYSDRSGNWLRAQIEADPASFIRSQDAFASFKTAWESAGSSVKYDSATGEYKFANYVFTLKDDYIATIKDTKTKVEYAFSEYGAASLTLPALGQVNEADKAAFVTAMKNSIEAANFHMEFTITSDETEMLFSTDVNAGTASFATAYVNFGGVNYPVMQVYREYSNGNLRFMQRQADMSSGMPSVNPKWETWQTQQGPAPDIVRQNDLYVCHPASMLTGGRSDDATLELMYILSRHVDGNTYEFFSFDLRTMQASNCSFKIENGYVSQVTVYMQEWLESLGADGESLVIEYSNYNETTVTKPAAIAQTALPVSRKEY